MNSYGKALGKVAKGGAKVENMVKTKMKDSAGVKAKLPYKFLKQTGAKDRK